MIKIVHIADLHLDSPFSGCTLSERNERREELKKALSDVCSYCRENSTDILLVAGDLFDGEFVRRKTIEYVAGCFASIPETRVFISPGNHDPYNSVSPYKYCRFPDNVHIFTDETLETVEISELGTAVYGYGFTTGKISSTPVSGIHPFDTSRINILVGHADLDDPTSPYYNIKISDIASSGLDYVALGHIHKQSGILNFGETVCAYSGCLVGRGFDECGERGMIAGEIAKGSVLLEYIPVTSSGYDEIEIDVTGKEISDIIKEVTEELSRVPLQFRVRVVLSGERLRDENIIDILGNALPARSKPVEIKDNTRESIKYSELLKEYSLRGAYARTMLPYIQSEDKETAEKAELALRYGLEALQK